jgi:hypothetical protein
MDTVCAPADCMQSEISAMCNQIQGIATVETVGARMTAHGALAGSFKAPLTRSVQGLKVLLTSASGY